MTQGKRVVVTGMGVVTPIGNTVEEFWESLCEGRSGLGPITKFDASACNCQVAAEVKNLKVEDHFEPKEIRRLEDFVKYPIIAAREASKASGILEAGLAPEDIGCLMGIGIGGIGFIEEQCKLMSEKGARRISPLLIPRIIANIAPGQVSIDLNLKGPSLALVTACAASTHAIGEAAELIRRGDAVAIFAGGSEASICELAIAGFGNMQALASNFNDRPTQASRPFDKNRSGFVMGEGAGMVVLEDYEFAKARGANILAEVKGYGLTSDAFHITAPAPDCEGGARSMALALKKAGLKPEDIDYINAHGTSTPLNDKNETTAIKTIFGDHAYKLAVSSTKSMTGHLLGAAGAIEAIASILAIQNDLIPPTINYTDPDPECDLDYVPNKARQAKLNYVMSNSLGFGGHNCTLILGRNGQA